MELETDASTDKRGQSRSRMCASFSRDTGGLQNHCEFNRNGLMGDRGEKRALFVLEKAYTEKTAANLSRIALQPRLNYAQFGLGLRHEAV
jgi:hypothetical protein